MEKSDVIIIGAGPSGSACARRLVNAGQKVTLLDRKEFPRPKLCAGWITPQVFRDLEISPEEYPGGLITFRRLDIYIKGFHIPVPTKQYSIRRIEFDRWMLERTGADFHVHDAKHIVKAFGEYTVDGEFQAPRIIGAGGTGCIVNRTFFSGINIRRREDRITTIEDEFQYQAKDLHCRLWFLDHCLPGYAWYVPKPGGYVNVGIGGKLEGMRKLGLTILDFWNLFVKKLEKKSLVEGRDFPRKGLNYYLRGRAQRIESDGAMLVGDSAGLATDDMGEGIGPAIRSGILAADSIISGHPYSLDSIRRYSLPSIILHR